MLEMQRHMDLNSRENNEEHYIEMSYDVGSSWMWTDLANAVQLARAMRLYLLC
jgi:hypothetical protein